MSKRDTPLLAMRKALDPRCTCGLRVLIEVLRG
jgi:hypothetical protein